MPRNGRRKRSLSSGEDSLVSYYSKHRCLEREYSPVSETRHLKRGSSPIRSRERRHNRQLTRNRSRSTRRSDRKTRRHKHRNDFPDSHAVRSHISVFVFLWYSQSEGEVVLLKCSNSLHLNQIISS